ncbi:MAG TPA: protein-L-isoaspartate(D-aspartate) O-methyltransferase [Vicinamibacterales bacterium]|nr:protein-L-isoaspartate(D-aspartate) O-methyltransferase [Vicinamibacterales bacterium]
MTRPHSWLVPVLLALAACGLSGTPSPQATPDRAAERTRMVDSQLRARDIRDPRVLEAMREVPRHLFVPETERDDAYGDFPLPIGYSQTISQPYIVGFMTQALEVSPEHKVLEIGTGSGYQAAILGRLAREVYTIEIVEPLAERSRGLLQQLGFENVHVRAGNGYLGWPEQAPFDRIMVTAAPAEVPPALVEQLEIGGRMAIPVGTVTQELRIMRRTEQGMETIETLPVRFVPMTGKPAQKLPG